MHCKHQRGDTGDDRSGEGCAARIAVEATLRNRGSKHIVPRRIDIGAQTIVREAGHRVEAVGGADGKYIVEVRGDVRKDIVVEAAVARGANDQRALCARIVDDRLQPAHVEAACHRCSPTAVDDIRIHIGSIDYRFIAGNDSSRGDRIVGCLDWQYTCAEPCAGDAETVVADCGCAACNTGSMIAHPSRSVGKSWSGIVVGPVLACLQLGDGAGISDEIPAMVIIDLPVVVVIDTVGRPVVATGVNAALPWVGVDICREIFVSPVDSGIADRYHDVCVASRHLPCFLQLCDGCPVLLRQPGIVRHGFIGEDVVGLGELHFGYCRYLPCRPCSVVGRGIVKDIDSLEPMFGGSLRCRDTIAGISRPGGQRKERATRFGTEVRKNCIECRDPETGLPPLVHCILPQLDYHRACQIGIGKWGRWRADARVSIARNGSSLNRARRQQKRCQQKSRNEILFH